MSLHYEIKQTTSSFLVLFIASFAFDAFVWFTTALFAVLRHAYWKPKTHHMVSQILIKIY